MSVRGIRGATSVENNTEDEIRRATREMLQELIEKNQIDTRDIASAFFSVTSDLNAVFPARIAREMGWHHVPMMCGWEMDVPGSLKGIIRVMIHLNTDKSQEEIKHIYLRKAVKLRPDLADR
ncbi:MAG: chorismate mutase [Bacillota bacterium]|jgi:chorismate mutase